MLITFGKYNFLRDLHMHRIQSGIYFTAGDNKDALPLAEHNITPENVLCSFADGY